MFNNFFSLFFLLSISVSSSLIQNSMLCNVYIVHSYRIKKKIRKKRERLGKDEISNVIKYYNI